MVPVNGIGKLNVPVQLGRRFERHLIRTLTAEAVTGGGQRATGLYKNNPLALADIEFSAI
jgi:hypothetical protein